ncbi:MAG TPA: substrate-binding domain-containing protein [Methanomicrobiales archaeon]|nr:substrate-binding domain-containing protein [Methanomicrobiales archaeon]
MKSKILPFVAGIVMILALVAVSSAQIPAAPTGNKTLLISTTTSLDNTGLLAAMEKIYQNETGVDLRFTAQGTGQAIDTAERCDADMVMVHAPSLEQQFIDAGYGINQRCFAYNYFIIVGPPSDPAGIKNMSPEEAFKTIYQKGTGGTPGVYFVSRGDNSGTHTREKELWQGAGYNYTNQVEGSGPWYLESGQGMGETLVLADQRGAYTLSDEGTYLATKSKLNLVPLVTNGSGLLNRYSAIAVSPSKCPNANLVESNKFINWVISPEGESLIANFGVQQYGQPLFYPLNNTSVCNATPFNCTCQVPINVSS